VDIRVLDVTPQCYTSEDGARVADYIRYCFNAGEPVNISFQGVTDVPSSFVNSSIVVLVLEYGMDFVKLHLKIIDANRQIADMIRRCIANALKEAP
jgi:hypothetical protein